MLVDSHCHLADPAFLEDREVVVSRAAEAGVGHCVVIGEGPDRWDAVLALVDRWTGLSATAGLHPHEASRWGPELEADLRARLTDPRLVAVGEMGLDYHYDHSPRTMQRVAFEAQMALATATGRPAVIHAREADDDVAAVLRNHPAAVAILHSFSSGPDLLHTAVALGHYVSWSGMITFRSWQADALVREVPLDRLLVETDAPYLAPVPHRGRRNEPAYVRRTAARLAEIRDLSVEEMISVTGENAARVFGARVRQDLQSGPFTRGTT